MRTSKRGLELIEQFEGFRANRYLDAVGVPTIGFGTTAADVRPLPATCNRAQAEAWLADNVARKYEPAVRALGVPLNQNQFDALVSLAYNLGPGVFGWQIGTDLRKRDYKAASADFMHYVYAGGRKLQGLVNRRAAERRLFDTPGDVIATVAVAASQPEPIAFACFDGDVFAQRPDGSVWHRHFDDGHWQPWVALGTPG